MHCINEIIYMMVWQRPRIDPKLMFRSANRSIENGRFIQSSQLACTSVDAQMDPTDACISHYCIAATPTTATTTPTTSATTKQHAFCLAHQYPTTVYININQKCIETLNVNRDLNILPSPMPDTFPHRST